MSKSWVYTQVDTEPQPFPTGIMVERFATRLFTRSDGGIEVAIIDRQLSMNDLFCFHKHQSIETANACAIKRIRKVVRSI